MNEWIHQYNFTVCILMQLKPHRIKLAIQPGCTLVTAMLSVNPSLIGVVSIHWLQGQQVTDIVPFHAPNDNRYKVKAQ